MEFSNGSSPVSVILSVVNNSQWATHVQGHLDQLGYQILVAADDEELRRIVTEQQPDAIIALREDEANFPVLDDSIGKDTQPLRVLITNKTQINPQNCTADLILSPDAFNSGRPIDKLLHAQAEMRHLKGELAELAHDNERLKQELQQQRRSTSEVEILKNAIVRNVSHELKTPLLQVKSAVSLLSEDPGNSKLLVYATDATARLETLVKNITLLGSSLDINPAPVIVRDAVEYSRRNLGRIWQHKGDVDRIDTDLHENLPPVIADKQGLSTVLQLLMDNALKFSKAKIEVCAEPMGEHVRISVRDFGIGIAKDQLEAIFESFYQIDSSSTRRYGGTGVGLAIVQLILDRHQSQIMVDSEIGKGSTFWFKLPAVVL
jgi:signal transduction histidine kinase